MARIFTEEERADAVSLYRRLRTTHTVEGVAAKVGCTPKTLSLWARASGLEIPPGNRRTPEEEPSLEVGARIRQFRKAKRWSIEEMEGLANVNYLGPMERGERVLRAVEIERLARVLGVTPAELTGDGGQG